MAPSLSPIEREILSNAMSGSALGSVFADIPGQTLQMDPLPPDTMPTGPTISTLSLTSDQVLQKAAEPGTDCIAFNIPLTLIAPLAVTALDNPPAASTVILSGMPPTSAWALDAIGASACPHDGAGVVVAVLDTGINKAHPAFDGIDILSRDFTGTGSPDDDKGHGTHRAAIIAGRNVDHHRIGVAPGITRLLNGKVLDRNGNGTSAQLYDAMVWAVREGANIISISIGFDFVAFAEACQAKGLPQSAAISRALEGYRANLRMFDKLVAMLSTEYSLIGSALIFAAAGNESRAAASPAFRIGVSLPAAAEKVVAVGAVGSDQTGMALVGFRGGGCIMRPGPQ